MIFCWYFSRVAQFKKILFYGILSSLMVTILYSCIEIPYLIWGNSYAKEALETINPYLFPIRMGFGWWPPLLWRGQLRSVFAEPSFFSIWAAFVIPFLVYLLFNTKNKWMFAAFFVFVSMIFLTNARTGVALLLGETTLFSIYFFLWNRKAVYLKKWGIILTLVMVSFLCVSGINFTKNNLISIRDDTIIGIEDYMENNLWSLSDIYARSNAARYGSTLAELYIGIDHPLLGVGRGLVAAYKTEYLPDFALQNKIVQNWLKHQNEEGIMKSAMPSLCVYTQRFAECGLLGLFLYLFPFGYLLWTLLNRIYKNKENLMMVCVAVSLSGLLASGLSNSLTVTYCLWLLLAAGYLMCFGKGENS